MVSPAGNQKQSKQNVRNGSSEMVSNLSSKWMESGQEPQGNAYEEEAEVDYLLYSNFVHPRPSKWQQHLLNLDVLLVGMSHLTTADIFGIIIEW